MKFSRKIKTIIVIAITIISLVAESSALHSFRIKNQTERTSKVSKAKQNSLVKTSVVPYEDIPAGCVRLWSECSYQGKTIDVCDKVNNYTQQNFTIKSIQVSQKNLTPSTFVYFYAPDFKGAGWSLDHHIHCWEDPRTIQSSYTVKNGCAVLYRECDYTDSLGAVYTCDPNTDIGTGKLFPDKALKSFISTQRAVVDLFEGPNGTGNKKTFTNYRGCLDDDNFGKNTSSMKITQAAFPPKPFSPPPFKNGRFVYTHQKIPGYDSYKWLAFTNSPMLPPIFTIKIRLIDVKNSEVIIGLSKEQYSNIVYDDLSERSEWNREEWGLLYGSISFKGQFISIKESYKSGDVLKIMGNNGKITYAINDKEDPKVYDLGTDKLFLAFTFAWSGQKVEILQ